MTRCRDHGANPRPKCKGCEHSAAAVNEAYVRRVNWENRMLSETSPRTQYQRYKDGATAHYDNSLFDEGSW